MSEARQKIHSLGGRFEYLYFFLFWGGGRGKEASEEGGQGKRFLIKNRGRGGGFPRRRHWRGKGARGMSMKRGGGAAKYFFSGPKCPPSSAKTCQTLPLSLDGVTEVLQGQQS